MRHPSDEVAPTTMPAMRYLWYSMYGFVTALAVYALFFRSVAVEQPPVIEPPSPELVAVLNDGETADVQIALILDTSSSMDGLVAQARAQLWEMVSEMQVGADGSEKTVAVALYQYGNNRLARRMGYIQQLTPLTTDLDEVTVKLYALSTSGGKEYAPMAIERVCDELQWSQDDATERYIVIAGNEGFHQGSVSANNAIRKAQDRGIEVMPIYCANRGASRTAIASWKQAAELANTDFESIDPDQRVAKIDSPYDDMIIEKYRLLQENSVYAPGQGQSQFAGQAQQCLEGSVAVDRALVQSRQNSSIDMVSAYRSGNLDFGSAPMPETLRRKSKKEQKAYFEAKAVKQAEIKREIAELESKRKSHLKANRAKAPSSNLGVSFKRNAAKKRGVLKSY